MFQVACKYFSLYHKIFSNLACLMMKKFRVSMRIYIPFAPFFESLSFRVLLPSALRGNGKRDIDPPVPTPLYAPLKTCQQFQHLPCRVHLTICNWRHQCWLYIGLDKLAVNTWHWLWQWFIDDVSELIASVIMYRKFWLDWIKQYCMPRK